jgi:RNA polymerase-binding transcription factor DksA
MSKSKPEKEAAKPAKPASEKKPAEKVPAAKPAAAKKGDPKEEAAPANGQIKRPANGHSGPITAKTGTGTESIVTPEDPFLAKQQDRLLQLRDNILDSMNGVAKDTLRSRAEGSEASAFGMHQADAGSDSYDRDFALSLLSQEQDALYEIEEALKRIDSGTYGVCEMSGKQIAHARLEAIPFARYTVECQAQIEKINKVQRSRTPVTSLFGLTDSEESGDSEEEETTSESKE